jgi:hypothetical protein
MRLHHDEHWDHWHRPGPRHSKFESSHWQWAESEPTSLNHRLQPRLDSMCIQLLWPSDYLLSTKLQRLQVCCWTTLRTRSNLGLDSDQPLKIQTHSHDKPMFTRFAPSASAAARAALWGGLGAAGVMSAASIVSADKAVCIVKGDGVVGTITFEQVRAKNRCRLAVRPSVHRAPRGSSRAN